MEEPLDQPDTLVNPPPKSPLGKVVMINFGILLAYILFTDSDQYLVLHAFAIMFQVFLNLLSGVILLFTRQRHIGRALLLSSVLVLIIGFGLCVGKAQLTGN